MNPEERPAPPVPPSPPTAPVPPAPPGHAPRASAESVLVEQLRGQLEAMETELARERERGLQLQELARRQDALREELGAKLKSSLEWFARREERAEREGGGGQTAVLEQLRSLREELGGVLRSAGQLQELRGRLEGAIEGQREDGAALREGLEASISRLQERLSSILSEMGHRFAMEAERYHERITAWTRERAALEAAWEEGRARLQQEGGRELAAASERMDGRLAELVKAVGQLRTGQEEAGKQATAAAEALGRLQDGLTRAQRAQGGSAEEEDQEKRNLEATLRRRTEELRAFVAERREVEKSLGESLMSLTRELEAEREKLKAAAQLRLELQSLQGQLELAGKAREEAEKRLAGMAAERDALASAMNQEAEGVRRQIAVRADADKAWEQRLREAESRADAERERREQGERRLADLEAQIQTLGGHMARTLEEREKAQAQASSWRQEREDLLAAIRKKDEMISLLSATFQNLLKPS